MSDEGCVHTAARPHHAPTTVPSTCRLSSPAYRDAVTCLGVSDYGGITWHPASQQCDLA